MVFSNNPYYQKGALSVKRQILIFQLFASYNILFKMKISFFFSSKAFKKRS